MPRNPRKIDRVDFNAEEPARIVAYMAQLTRAGDGWINLIPKVTEDDERPTSLRFFTLFGGGASGITMCTWIAGNRDHNGENQPSLGITHLTGHRAAGELAAHSILFPKAWRVEQDHPRRGLVLRIPFDESDEQVLLWAMQAVDVLSPPRSIGGWRADIYLPNTS